MIKQDISENLAKKAYLAIGSNLGNRKLNIEKAKLKLRIHKIEIINCSSNYETLSWPNPKNPSFLNIVIEIKTFLSAIELMKKCLLIENQLGRKRKNKNDPRTCDIDIIDYDQKVISYSMVNSLKIPHPEMHKRNFVLLPLFEISKNWLHPLLKKDIKKLINSLKIGDLRAIKLI